MLSICPFLAVLDCNPTSSKPHSPWLNVHTRSGWPSQHRDPRMNGWVTIRQVCCGYDLFVGPLPTLVWWVLSSWTVPAFPSAYAPSTSSGPCIIPAALHVFTH